ncbi:MAG: CHASE2 domain-containing protein, partial [Pseudomonadota bacterium]
MTSLLTLRQRLLLVLAAGLLAGALIWGLRATGWLQQAELWQYDITTAALAGPEPLPDVTLVALTDADLSRSGWPVSDTHLARLAEAALDAGARTVGIDLYRDLPVGEGRDRLLSVLQDPKVVVISRLADAETTAITAPLEAQSGFADVPIDPDGVARRALLLVTTQSAGVALSFPLKLAMSFTGTRDLRPAPENSQHLAFGPTSVPPIETDTGPYARIDASGYQVITQYRHALPLVRRVRPDALLDGTAAIAGQLVIIGLTSDTVKDYFSTPLSRYTGADFTFGAEVHAAIAQQLIDYSSGRLAPLRSLQASTEAVLVFLTALAGAWCAVLWPARLYSLAAGCGGVLLGGPGLAYAQNAGLLLPAVPASLAWATAFIAAFIVVATLARRHRRIMVELFASQLSEDLSAEIWNQRDRLLEGRKPVSRKLFVT